MRVMDHSWSATKQYLHLQSVGERDKPPFSFVGAVFDNVGHRLGVAKRTQINVIFSTSLSVAAFLRRAGGSMLESTGSHGRGVERRVPEMSCMVEFNWTAT